MDELTDLRDADLGRALHALQRDARDEAAWAVVFRILWPFVVGSLIRLGARTSATDAGQEVFLRLARYCRFDKLQDPSALRAYTWMVCRNVARDWSRREGSEPASNLGTNSVTLAGIMGPEYPTTPLDVVIRHVAGKLKQPADRRLLLQLFDGKTVVDIANEEGIPYGTAAVRIHRLKRRLKEIVKSGV